MLNITADRVLSCEKLLQGAFSFFGRGRKRSRRQLLSMKAEAGGGELLLSSIATCTLPDGTEGPQCGIVASQRLRR